MMNKTVCARTCLCVSGGCGACCRGLGGSMKLEDMIRTLGVEKANPMKTLASPPK